MEGMSCYTFGIFDTYDILPLSDKEQKEKILNITDRELLYHKCNFEIELDAYLKEEYYYGKIYVNHI
jgi:hypothetical protein